MIQRGQWSKADRVPKQLDKLPGGILTVLESVSELAYTGLFKEGVQLVYSEDAGWRRFPVIGSC